MFERIGLRLLQSVNPELAHNIALRYLRMKIDFSKNSYEYPKLKTVLAGIRLQNPLGLAAGFDKNAIALKSLSNLGFGFIEVGAVTPLPQRGNPKPRLFRIKNEKAIINRFGFNNDGMIKINERLRKFRKK